MSDTSENEQRRRIDDPEVLREEERRMGCVEADLRDIKTRVYNGLGAELRKEVNAASRGTLNIVVGLLVALLVALAGAVLMNKYSSDVSTTENMRNYKAILDLQAQVAQFMFTDKAHEDKQEATLDALVKRGRP